MAVFEAAHARRSRQKRKVASARCGAVTSSAMSADHRRRTARRIDQPELVADRVVSDQQMRAILGVTPHEFARQIGERDRRYFRSGGRRCQDDDRRQFVGTPEDGDVIGASVWIGQEIVTPSAGRGHRSRDRLGLGRCRRRPDSQGCGAGTPRRGRRAPWWPRIDRRLATANPPSTWTCLLARDHRMPGVVTGLICVVGRAVCRPRIGIRSCPNRIGGFQERRKAGSTRLMGD